METLTQGLLSLMLHCTGRLLADPHLQGGVMKWSMSTGVRSGGRPRARDAVMAGKFHQASGRRLQEWEFHHTELRLEYGGGALVFVDRDQWDEVQFVSSGRVSLCEISSASPALVSVHCYPRSSSFHFLNSVSKNVAFLFMLIHESFPKNRREKRWVPFFNCMHEAFPFRHWSSRRG